MCPCFLVCKHGIVILGKGTVALLSLGEGCVSGIGVDCRQWMSSPDWANGQSIEMS